jgi:hypothetical protein
LHPKTINFNWTFASFQNRTPKTLSVKILWRFFWNGNIQIFKISHLNIERTCVFWIIEIDSPTLNLDFAYFCYKL